MEQEDYRLLPLATVGLAKGIYEVYMKPHNKQELIENMGILVGVGGLAVSAYLFLNKPNETVPD